MTYFEWIEILAAAAARGEDLDETFPRVLVCDDDDEQQQQQQ